MNSPALLFQLLLALPSLFVGLFAILFALFRWKRHPKASAFAVAAFLFQIAGGVIGMVNQTWILTQAERGIQPSEIAQIAAAMSGAQLFCGLLFLILIVVAVFIDRAPRTAHLATERSA